MQNRETVQEYEHERNEVIYPENVAAEGGVTPRSAYIQNMSKKTSHQPMKGRSRYLRAANQAIDPLIIQNIESRQQYEHERNEVSYWYNVCAEGQYNAMLCLYWKHEPDDDETSINKWRSRYLRTAYQGIDPSIMKNKETVEEYEHRTNEVSYPENVGAERTKEDETTSNEGRSKYLRTANQGIEPSIMQTKETVQE